MSSYDYNRIIISGRLARDPEVRFTPNKQKAARFTVASGQTWKDRTTKEAVSHTDWINCVAWSGTAEMIEKYTKKGDHVLIDGKLSVRDYTGRDGQRKWITEVVVERVLFLGGRQQRQEPQQPAAESEEDFPLDFSEEVPGGEDAEIPF